MKSDQMLSLLAVLKHLPNTKEKYHCKYPFSRMRAWVRRERWLDYIFAKLDFRAGYISW